MRRWLGVLLCVWAGGAAASDRPTSPSVPSSASSGAELPSWSSQDARRDRYVSVHGLRAFAGGYSEDGLEFWAFPLQIASGYQLDFVIPDQATVAGIDVLQSVDVQAASLTRHYAGKDFRVSETLYTQGQLPGVRVSYQIEGRADVQLRVRLRPSLNLQWPVGIGGQEVAWDEQPKGFRISEPSHRFEARIASPQAGEHSIPNNDRRGSEFGLPLFMQLHPQPCGKQRCASLIFAGRSEATESSAATVSSLSAAQPHAQSDVQRYADATRLRLTTPDADTNRALQWAQIALEQYWSCNARLGCGLVAGHGPSHGARRNQYAWFFAGDGLVGTRALIHNGQYARAADELAFILRYQHPDNGMIWHEMSQSAGFVDWANDYHYMYVHVDIAFDFLSVLAEYDRATGDRAFLRKHWPAVMKAWEYCLSTLDADDGLPRVPSDKMSANEQDKLSDELTLSAAWVEAAQSMARLAQDMDLPDLSARASAASERARVSIRQRYRDNAGQRWISGFTHSGQPGQSFLGADLAAMGSGAATAEETAATLAQLASPAYLTAWGLRSKPDTASDYDPSVYSKGSVWGLGTASAAEALWKAGRGEQASAIWQRLVPWAHKDSLGHLHEVMRGDEFSPQRESVPEQMWSSAAFLSAAVGGLYGIEVDAHGPVLHFRPQPPQDWNTLKVEGLRVGPSTVTLEWLRAGPGESLEIVNNGPAFELIWAAGNGEQRQTVHRGKSSFHRPLP